MLRSVDIDDVYRVAVSNARAEPVRFELRLQLPEERASCAPIGRSAEERPPIFRLTIPAHGGVSVRYQHSVHNAEVEAFSASPHRDPLISSLQCHERGSHGLVDLPQFRKLLFHLPLPTFHVIDFLGLRYIDPLLLLHFTE